VAVAGLDRVSEFGFPFTVVTVSEAGIPGPDTSVPFVTPRKPPAGTVITVEPEVVDTLLRG
jgi:hypothetical protein